MPNARVWLAAKLLPAAGPHYRKLTEAVVAKPKGALDPDRYAELGAAYKRFEGQLIELYRNICVYEIVCQEILSHPLDWRDEIVAKLPELADATLYVLSRKKALALDHAVETLSELTQKVYDAFYRDFEPALRSTTGVTS